MRRALLLLGIFILIFVSITSIALAESERIVVVSHWGGVLGNAYRESAFNEFERETGIKVVEVTSTNNAAKIKAMVESNNVDIDLMEGSELEINRFSELNYLEPIDYSYFPQEVLDGMPDVSKNPYGCGSFAYASVIAYRTDVFPTGNHPTSWVDFWDTERFPGKRTLVSGTSGDYPPLEYALLGDGVSPDNLYPLDIERGFKALDRIKPHVEKWWTSGSQAAQMLLNKEVVLAEAFSGRIADLKNKGVPVEIEWNQGMFNQDYWLMPKGAPHKEDAYKLLAFMTDAKRQAKFSELSGYGAANMKAYDFIPSEVAENLPTSPENFKKLITVNNAYWAEHMPKIQEMWQEWEMK
jgi:putative spermidine/putrescine transport system substrate-binding protein